MIGFLVELIKMKNKNKKNMICTVSTKELGFFLLFLPASQLNMQYGYDKHTCNLTKDITPAF